MYSICYPSKSYKGGDQPRVKGRTGRLASRGYAECTAQWALGEALGVGRE